MKRYLLVAVLAGLMTACIDDTSGPDGSTDESDLNFVRLESSAAVTVRQASFWAVKGATRTLIMRYAPRPGASQGERFVELEVGANTLLARPNGTPFLNGDSILITARLDDSNRLIMHFEPSGLTFNPLSPARLVMSYALADLDIDDDNDVDDRDRVLELRLQLWRQEQPGLPWLPLPSLRLNNFEIEARLLGFTAFAMASE